MDMHITMEEWLGNVFSTRSMAVIQGAAERTPRFPSYALPKSGRSFCRTLYKEKSERVSVEISWNNGLLAS
jgi:hypothetical protein